jgi:hypothetical protein
MRSAVGRCVKGPQIAAGGIVAGRFEHRAGEVLLQQKSPLNNLSVIQRA